MEGKTDKELKSMLEHALDSALSPMHELERRGFTVEIDTTTLEAFSGDQPDGLIRTTIFNLRVCRKTTEDL